MTHTRWWALLPAAALLACATVLRAPIAVIPPLLPDISGDLHLDAARAGLLTSIPVLCFGVLTPLASWLLRVVGINHAFLYCLAGVVAGSLVLSFGSTAAAFTGVTILGAALTIGNLAVPMLITRQFRDRAALLTGSYAAMVNVTVTVATATAVPIAAVVGWRWSAASGGVVLGLLAFVVWAVVYPPGVRGARASIRRRAGLAGPAARVGPSARSRTARDRDQRVSRRRVVWLLVAAFSGHTLAYYAVTAWLPSALADMLHMTPAAAGAASSLFQAAGIAGPFLVPALLDALRWPLLRTMATICGAWLVLPLGLLVAPSWWVVWSSVSGAAQGAFFAVLFVVVIRRARDVDESRRMTSLIQTIGYIVAAAGPVALGWIHQHVATWDAAFAVVLGALLVMSGCAVAAVRDRSVPAT